MLHVAVFAFWQAAETGEAKSSKPEEAASQAFAETYFNW